ncbi:hypothetical protein N9Y75_04005 [Candidatus Poseidoniales archaeon]|nr:hypothetical protein [Candidatus Poseidoniales archaeon]
MNPVGNGLINHHRVKRIMESRKRIIGPSLAFMLLASTLLVFASPTQADITDEISILHTAVNPDNNKTYHLLSASSWEDAAFRARSLDGYLTTVDSDLENAWIFDTFAGFDNQSRHIWIGLNDVQDEGMYRWHDGTPFLYRSWGEAQPTGSDDADYVHIASTNMGNIMPGTWNDLENNPEYFPVYGVVEVGQGADFSLRFNGVEDHVKISNDDGLQPNASLLIEATIKPSDLSGIRFITMKGDYGWGMYLSEGYIGYSSEYSLSKHPLSNMSVTVDNWSTIEVEIIEGVGGEFRIDGMPVGNISVEDANIPVGDFGSNDCFTSGASCDELYIARMGAGCDCYHFEGIIDDVTIKSMDDMNWEIMTQWTFWEGEGSDVGDSLNDEMFERNGEIHGADWVMPDGSIIAQAIELINEDYIIIEDVKEGDTLLFYVDVEDLTRYLDVSFWAWSDYYWEEDVEEDQFNVYVGYDEIPAPWDYDMELTGWYGSVYGSFTWPEHDVMWFALVANQDLEELEVSTYWDLAKAPPSLEEMTELFKGVPITQQSNQAEDYEAAINYYFVNVTEPLTELKVETYGGKGNIQLAISKGGPVDPDYGWDIGFIDDILPGDGTTSSTMEDWSTGQGNNEEVNLFDVEPGIYYVVTYTYRKANDYTILADMNYAPTNADPTTAVELTPGIAYGPMSGYDGLDQYFFIDVPTGTERLEVDLNGGFGEASLHMRIENTPTASEADHHSGSPGAGDKIAFNNPTPGKWYILLDSETVFSGVEITASFADLYIWEYDGTPVQLFKDEQIDGLSAPSGEDLFFYVEVGRNTQTLIINTFGGSGELLIEGDGETDFGFDDFDFFDEDMMDSGRQFGEEEWISYGEGTYQELYIYFPAEGRFDITVTSMDDFSEVSIVATWDGRDGGPDGPDEPVDPEEIMPCDEGLKEMMTDNDINGDGLISASEFKYFDDFDGRTIEFSEINQNDDSYLEFNEIVAFACSCENELALLDMQIDGSLSLSDFDKIEFKNDYQSIKLDFNQDEFIDSFELSEFALVCETSYNPMDTDGDGVLDPDDQFPNDPDEQSDADGDGVGDNADFAPSVSNDVVYSAGAVMLLVLFGVLVLIVRGSSRGPDDMQQDQWNKTDAFAERMMAMDGGETMLEAPNLGPVGDTIAPITDEPMQAFEAPSELKGYDFGNESSFTAESQPPASLMGMMDSQGREHIEYPAQSGKYWHRTSPDSPWMKD